MAAIEVGKKYVKTRGRKAGTVVTITKVVDQNFVMAKDDKGKEKRSNITHLEPLA